MKKIIIVLIAVGATALTLQSCQKPADNSKTQARIDSLTNVKITAYRDSLMLMCMNDVMAQATARADSMMQASMKKGGSKKSSPKKSTTGTVSDRPGAQEGQPSSVKDREGTTNTSGPKSVTDRKGANPPPPPPKQ